MLSMGGRNQRLVTYEKEDDPRYLRRRWLDTEICNMRSWQMKLGRGDGMKVGIFGDRLRVCG
jgi:hypothetical protein